jgi:hypothetical protein
VCDPPQARGAIGQGGVPVADRLPAQRADGVSEVPELAARLRIAPLATNPPLAVGTSITRLASQSRSARGFRRRNACLGWGSHILPSSWPRRPRRTPTRHPPCGQDEVPRGPPRGPAPPAPGAGRLRIRQPTTRRAGTDASARWADLARTARNEAEPICDQRHGPGVSGQRSGRNGRTVRRRASFWSRRASARVGVMRRGAAALYG